MNAENTKLELLKRQKRQAELALKSQIRIAKSILKGHQPLNTYHFQKAIEEIKQFRNLSRKVKQSFKDCLTFLKCTNNALLEGEKGYIKRQGKVPKFELTAKGIAANRIFQFILNYESQAELSLLERQIQVDGVLGAMEEDLLKILENIKQIRGADEDSGED